MSELKNIAVIGAGLMGHGIAQIFAVKGYSVAMMDVADDVLAKAIENIRSNLNMMVQKGIGNAGDVEPALSRIRTTRELSAAAGSAQFVVEAVKEDLKTKQDLFQELDACCPDTTILATNTSVISITEIAGTSRLRQRIVGTHFWNPPYLIPLVEVIKGKETSADTMERTFRLLQDVGKHPVRVQKDVPGFVGNRLQHALWREAISIVEHGIADAATVDECIRYGFGMRLPVLGPLETADMVGLDLTLAIHEYILRHLDRSPEPSPLLREKANAGDLGFKSGKGFREWTPEEIRSSRQRLQAYLMGVAKGHGDSP
jgi:3-hydroxybutyryl-CoA dehydrogenase